MPITIISTATISQSHGVKVCVYGRSGTGKTRLCATAPAPVILSAENGLLSLRQYNLPAIQINNYFDLQEAYNWAMQSHEARQFHTICLDSVSEIAETILGEEKKGVKDPRKAYGATQDQVLALLRNFRDMPYKHVYFVAKQWKVKDEGSGLLFNSAAMPGQQLPQHIPYFFDELFQLVIGKDNQGQSFRALRTQPDPQNDAKDRSGVLNEWEPADLSYIFNKIMNGPPQQ
jgi:hypothetical protein